MRDWHGRCVRTSAPEWAAEVAGAALRTARRGPLVRIVAVEGRSGSGKSTVAEEARRALAELGEPVAVLTMEDLYPGWLGLAEAPELLREWVLLPLRHGGAARWRRYDWARGAFRSERVGLPAELAGCGGTLIVEGCGCGARTVRDLVDLLVWVEADERVRAARLDSREDAHLYAPFRSTWARQEEEFYALHRPREHAGLHVDNG